MSGVPTGGFLLDVVLSGFTNGHDRLNFDADLNESQPVYCGKYV